jgi:hypothetical protein
MNSLAQIFANHLQAKYGDQFRHVNIFEHELSHFKGKAIMWDSFDDIEVVEFEDGSRYEPNEREFIKNA